MEYCAYRHSCVRWLEIYLNNSVGGMRNYVSLAFGMISVISWAVAEIPQIFTNFMTGSTEGVSLAFLMTWVVGCKCCRDLFNLIGCLLEPATIPTQFYTALVYTITTVVLVWQTLYYDHINKWWKARKDKAMKEYYATDDGSHTEPMNVPQSIAFSAETAKKNDADHLNKQSNGTATSRLPIPSFSRASERSIGRNRYYMSARSLANSHTPTPGSYLTASSRGSGRSGPSYILDQSSVEDEGLLANIDFTSPKNPKTMLRSVAATVFFVGGLNFFYLRALPTFDLSKMDSMASVMLTGRKILQEANTITIRDSMIVEQFTSLVGTWLGWVMAAIYMGGRLPQIWKNVQRGTIEGLNPLMFLFALIGNAAYVGSIIVKTLEWRKLKPNMPWLVDAAVCVLLDCFILGQFIYYRLNRTDENNGDNEAIKP